VTVVARGIDFSAGWPSLDALADVDFVVRYVAPGRSVSMTAAELAHWRQAGKQVCGVWERTADRALAGRDAGAHDMREAMDYVVAIGGPADAPVYMVADDWGATAAQGPAIADYLAGAVSVRGHDRTGAYGGLRAIRYLADHDACRLYWQTYAWSGASQARAGDVVEGTTAWDPRATLWQRPNGVQLGGVEVDIDRATRADYGQWWYQGGDDMPTIQELNDAAKAGQLDDLCRRVMVFVRDQAGLARPVDVRAAVLPLLDDEAKAAQGFADAGMAETQAVAQRAALAEAVSALSAGGGQVDLDALSARMYAAADQAIVDRLGRAAG
jgi:hypothetical protein